MRWLFARRYFHGGAPGLAVGDEILPRNELPRWRGLPVRWGDGRSAEEFGDLGDTVSFTSDLAIARGYAGEYSDLRRGRLDGAVYRVAPIGDSEKDPDFPFSEKVIRRAARARIVQVVERVPIEENPRVLARSTASHRRQLSNGAPVYDDAGFIIPDPMWIRHGATPEQLRALGPWMPLHLISREHFGLTEPLPPLLP